LSLSEILLQSIGVEKNFVTGAGILPVLKGVDLEINRGEIVAVIGASGVGKSTLLHILGALDRPTNGKVSLNSVDIFSKNDKELADFRNKTVGFVFQFHHLLPEFTAWENVFLPGLVSGAKIEEVKEKSFSLLKEVGLEQRATHKPGELSGGEQQRVAVARALMNDPELVIADEPSGNLDKKTGESLHNLIKELNINKHQTFVIATHNLELAQKAHKIYKIMDGKAYLIEGNEV
jgi:lipoprotein-releasing system ATP-binding protein